MPGERLQHLRAAGAIALATLALGPAAMAPGGELESFPEKGPPPVRLPHFPRPLDAFVFRNWGAVPLQTMARAIDAPPEAVEELARAMGLGDPPNLNDSILEWTALTAIRRNWHILPYVELLRLLGWTEEKLAFHLREDDFLWIKLGRLKPSCPPLRWEPIEEGSRPRYEEIRRIVEDVVGPRGLRGFESPLGFREELDRIEPVEHVERIENRDEEGEGPLLERGTGRRAPRFGLRLLYPYFGKYADPFLGDGITEGYLTKISRSGVNGLWLPALLDRLDESDPDSGRRLEGLRGEVRRAALQGVKIFLYLNEPRAKPTGWFEGRADRRGVAEGAFHARCTSHPETREWMARVAERIAREVPDLGGFFTISMSENLTSCWSHGGGKACPRCAGRPGPEVVAEANRALFEGVRRGSPSQRFIAWDWGWPDDWIPAIVEALPPGIDLMSVSEWGVPIERGGIRSSVGEYSISAPGPGARARRTWELARRSGRRAVAKIQAGSTWELSAVPYIPVPRLVAGHVDRLSREGVDDLMLGWTLGGWPSPNIEVAAQWFFGPAPSIDAALERVARRRFGKASAAVVEAWTGMGEAFSLFPFHGEVVYQAPLQFGPANLLHTSPTGYKATMIGFPYDDLDGWRAIYPPDVYVESLKGVSAGWAKAMSRFADDTSLSPRARRLLGEEKAIAAAAQVHFESAALQGEFVRSRDALARGEGDPHVLLERIERIARDEIQCARRLLDVLRADSRIGFEPTNHYYYLPVDLAEKVLNCRWIIDAWIPAERRKRR